MLAGRRHLFLVLTAAVPLLLLQSASSGAAPIAAMDPERGAPTDAAAAGEPTLGGVTVEASRRRELVTRRIDEFVAATVVRNPDDSIARWQVPICPAIIGLPVGPGASMFDRVSQVAQDAGIPVGAPDCRPNLLVAMTREPEALLRSWLRTNPRLFERERGVAATERTIRTPAPVRVFYNACDIPAAMTETFGTRVVAACNADAEIGSKLRRAAARIIYSAVVVVDLQRIGSVELGALSDHVAMRSLAQLRPDPAVSDVPTILRRFDGSESIGSTQMSAWYHALLKSLYAVDPGNVAQLRQMKRLMGRELER